jgi:hypothetical protein
VARVGPARAGEAPQAATARDLDNPADRLHAERPDHVWALDYQFEVTSKGRTLKILHVVDEYTRESLADVVAYNIDADATVAILDKIVSQRDTTPTFIPCDKRARAHRERVEGLVPLLALGCELHRSWQPLAAPLGRVLRVTHARRVARDRAVRFAPRSPSTRRRLARRVQRLPPPQRARHARTRRVRCPTPHRTSTPTLITGGPTIG